MPGFYLYIVGYANIQECQMTFLAALITESIKIVGHSVSRSWGNSLSLPHL